jgi:hypothetical protein
MPIHRAMSSGGRVNDPHPACRTDREIVRQSLSRDLYGCDHSFGRRAHCGRPFDYRRQDFRHVTGELTLDQVIETLVGQFLVLSYLKKITKIFDRLDLNQIKTRRKMGEE